MSGMHDVGTNWNGTSVTHEVTMEDHYEFSWGKDIEQGEPLRAPPMGEASLVLPPFMASTGLQPSEPNPYLGTRDASYTSGSANHHACKMDDAYVIESEEEGIPWDDFSPTDDQLYSPWQLGEHDMQALFMDLHSEDYMEALDVAMANLEADPEKHFYYSLAGTTNNGRE